MATPKPYAGLDFNPTGAPGVSLHSADPNSPFFEGVRPPAPVTFTPSADATLVSAPAAAFTPAADATLISAPTAPFTPSADAARVYTLDEFKTKSVDELVADKDYQPVNFGVQNKAALLADPALQSKQEQVYRARETAGTTAMDKLQAAKKGALPGLQALFSGVGQAIKTGAKLGGAGIAIPAVNALKALTGPEGSGIAYAEDLGKSGAELTASVELASLGTADLLRRSARELGESKLAPISPVNIALRAGNKPKAEQTEGDWRNRYFNDVELAQKVEEAGRGSAEVMKLVGIDAETLKRDHDIDLDPQVISELSVVTNPVNYIPVGAVVGAVTSVGGKLVTRGLAAAKTAAQASEFAGILNKAAEAAAVTKSVGSGVTGGALKAVGGTVEATGDAAQAAIRAVLPRGAQYGVGLGSLLGGNVYKALGGLAVVKGIPKALQVGGSALKRAGAVVAGEAELPAALSLAGQTAKQATLGGLQAGVEGAIISLPFEIGARPEEEEQVLGMVALGAAAGAGIRGARPGVRATGRAAQNKLAETIFQHVEQADAPETPRYEGAPDALNDAHDANYATLSPSDKKLVNWGRRLAPAEDLQIFTLDSAGMKAETSSATAKGYAVKVAERADGKPVVHIYLNADAQALPHEFFHALELLDPKPAKALVEAGKKALTPAQFKAFEQYYNTLRNDGLPEKFWKNRLTKDEVFREVAAEGFSRTFLAQDLSGVAPAVRQKAALFVSGLLEKLGAPLAGVNLKKGTPGASTLGVRPGTESVKLGQQWLGDILSRVNDDGTLATAPAKVEKAPITVADVKPTSAILSAEDLDIATSLRRNQVSDKAIARHFGLTEADILGALGPGKGAKPKPAAPAEAPVPVPPPRGPAVVPPEPITFPSTPIAPPSPAAPRNIRTTRTTPRDSAGERSQVTGIEEAKVAAAATGDANTVARVNELADLLNQPVEIVHSGAKAAGTVEAPSGRTVRRAEIASGGVREKYSKVTIPDRWVVVAGKPQLLAFSLDKIFTNMDTLAAKAAEKGVSEKIPYPTEGGKFSEATAEQIVQDLGAYAENQRNGRKGDGTPLTRPTEEIGISIPPENPDYVPRKLTEERMNFINALMGTDPFVPRTSRETKGQVPGNVKGQIIAEVNKRKPKKPSVMRPEDITKQEFKSYPGRSIAEMNPLRDELAAAGVPMRELLDANERIFAKDISQVVPRPELDFKAPVTDTIRGGFLPGELLAPGNFWLEPDGNFKPVDSHLATDAAYRKGWIRAVVREDGNGVLHVELNGEKDRISPNVKQSGAIRAAASEGMIVEDGFRNFSGDFLPGDTAKQISEVQAMSSDEFAAATKSWDGGLTKQAWKIGLEAASPEDVAALKAANVDAGLKARAAIKEKDFTTAGTQASRAQFFREAFEAATDTGSAAGDIGWRVAFPDWQAPFPEAKTGDFSPNPDLRAIEMAAVRDKDGTIWRGRLHGEALERANQDGYSPVEISDPGYEVRLDFGFVTNEGEFLTRDEALIRGKEFNQIPKGYAPSDKDIGIHSTEIGNTAAFPEGKAPTGAFLPAATFYSELQRVIDEKVKGESIPAAQLAALVRNSGIKPEELKWSGLDDYLAGKSKVSVPELKKFLRDNEVQLEEVTKGDPAATGLKIVENPDETAYAGEPMFDVVDSRNGLTRFTGDSEGATTYVNEESQQPAIATKFENYQVPGGLNYRELLLTLPGGVDRTSALSVVNTSKDVVAQRKRHLGQILREQPKNLDGISKSEKALSRAEEALRQDQARLDALGSEERSQFRSSHFDEPNVLAHVRFNERLDAEGGRVLFLEEVQSDWHQAGKKKGYRKSGYTASDVRVRESKFLNSAQDEMHVVEDMNGGTVGSFIGTKEDAISRAVERLNKEGSGEETGGVPDAPFKKTWPLLAVKRMIRYAAENDFDKVAWTPGDVQAARYDLSKQVSEIQYNPKNQMLVAYDKGAVAREVINQKVEPNKLDDYIGKDAAQKLLDAPLESFAPENEPVHVLQGDALRVGGEGMRGFYDQILPKEVGAYVKKWGAKVEQEPVIPAAAGRIMSGMTEKERVEYLRDVKKRNPEAYPEAWSVTLTPSMRSDVLTKGQKMFLPKGGGVMPAISPSEITPRSPTVLPPLRPDDMEKRR